MRAEHVFDICLERYRGLRAFLRSQMRAVKLDVPAASGYQWRPDRARAAEYVADFELAGERALDRPSWKGRRRLFVIYFLRGVEYRRAIALVGVPSGTFDWWTQQVKRTVGREFERVGLFPPGRYFRERSYRMEKSEIGKEEAGRGQRNPEPAREGEADKAKCEPQFSGRGGGR